MNLIMNIVFKTALSVWERNHGNVPTTALAALDQANDWPPGVAATAVNRLNRDKQLAKQIRRLSDVRVTGELK